MWQCSNIFWYWSRCRMIRWLVRGFTGRHGRCQPLPGQRPEWSSTHAPGQLAGCDVYQTTWPRARTYDKINLCLPMAQKSIILLIAFYSLWHWCYPFFQGFTLPSQWFRMENLSQKAPRQANSNESYTWNSWAGELVGKLTPTGFWSFPPENGTKWWHLPRYSKVYPRKLLKEVLPEAHSNHSIVELCWVWVTQKLREFHKPLPSLPSLPGCWLQRAGHAVLSSNFHSKIARIETVLDQFCLTYLWPVSRWPDKPRRKVCVLFFQSPRTRTMPDIAKSDISPNLDRDKMFNELWWLNYCFCEGVGIGAVGNPFFGGEAVNICCHSRCEMTDVGDPFCSNVRVCLCLTDQCALPPAEGSPICVCFNKKLAGADGWSGQQLFDWSTSFGDTFWLYYIFCMGLGFSAPQANGRPLFAVQTKELCIKGGTKLATPMEGGKLCSMVSTRLCFWEQCAMPPAEGAPMFSCFNLLNKKGASAKPLAYGA